MEVMLTTLAGLFKPDERFVMHRYYSSRLALAAALISTVGWFNYELIANHHLRWDLVAIVGVTGVTKIAAMLYYRTTQ